MTTCFKDQETYYGILPVNKPENVVSFALIKQLRRLTKIKTIGHAGTLDPFATGVMLLLIGRPYTKLSNLFLTEDKVYETTLQLGSATDSFDTDGTITDTSSLIPSKLKVLEALEKFQGTIEQVPPMFSAKKQNGQKLYTLARQGLEVARQPVTIRVETTLLSYEYPYIKLRIRGSKGTYIRSIGHDIGLMLGCFAHLKDLTRTVSGSITLEQCIDGNLLFENSQNPCILEPYLLKSFSNKDDYAYRKIT